MKRKSIIVTTSIVYIVVMIGMFLGVDAYVKSKDRRLYSEICGNLTRLFDERDTYVDVAHSGYSVEYDRIPIPRKPVEKDFERLKNHNSALFCDWIKKRIITVR